jgi:hypothetical protein
MKVIKNTESDKGSTAEQVAEIIRKVIKVIEAVLNNLNGENDGINVMLHLKKDADPSKFIYVEIKHNTDD